jgi:hypothetical protein
MNIQVNSGENWPDDFSDAGDQLSHFFAAYRDACPDGDGSANFLPSIWEQIEARQSFWFSFERLARASAAVAVAVCMLLVGLNVAASRKTVPGPGGYADALAAANSAEGTYYAEGIRTTAVPMSREPVAR